MNQCRQHPDDLEVGECYPTDPDELIAWTEAFPRFEEDLYCILMDRLSGEAHTKVASVPPGQGISAYVKVYLWYSGTSGMALQERASMVMHPKVPKSDEEISSVLEQWLTDCRKMEEHGNEYKLPAPLKICALQRIMSGKEDIWETFIRMHSEKPNDETKFEILVKDILDYGNRKRLEAQWIDGQRRQDKRLREETQGRAPMDLGSVRSPKTVKFGTESDTAGKGPTWNQTQKGNWDGWTDEVEAEEGEGETEQDWTEEQWNDYVMALGKGKAMSKGGKGKGGKGKGKGMNCWNCGKPGHQKWQCTAPPKGGGKGKWGKGKGKGKDGKGKGWNNEVAGWEESPVMLGGGLGEVTKVTDFPLYRQGQTRT